MLALQLYIALVFILQRLFSVPLLRFDSVATLSWAFGLGLGAAPLLVYPDPLSTYSVVLLIGSHLGMIAGFLAYSIGRDPFRYQQFEGLSATSRPREHVVLSILSMAFGLLSLADAFGSGTVPLLGSLSRLSSTRAEFLASGEIGGVLTQLTTWFSYPAIVTVALLPLYLRRRDRFFIFLGAWCFLSLVDLTFRYGGRSAIVICIVAATAVDLSMRTRREYARRLVALTLLMVCVFVALGSVFVTSRNQGFTSDPSFFVARNCGFGQIHEAMREAPESSKALIQSSCYFSAAPYIFDLYLDGNRDSWTATYGGYNSGRIFRPSLVESRDEIANYFESIGHASNPWATSVRDVWLDFKDFTPLVFVGIGALAAALTPRGRESGDLELAKVGLLTVAAFFVPLLSPFILTQVFYPIVFLVLMSSLRSVLPPAVHTRRRPVEGNDDHPHERWVVPDLSNARGVRASRAKSILDGVPTREQPHQPQLTKELFEDLSVDGE